MDTDTRRDQSLLAWQWATYRQYHRSRKNLLLHVLTQPLFVSGLIALPLAAVYGPGLVAAGLGSMVVAVGAQGAGHKQEQNPPAPFRGPFDVVARLFVEQLVTFPRFVLSGELFRAWRTARAD